MNFVQKLLYILTPVQKKQLKVLAFLLFIGMLFEMAGLGVLLPTLTIIMDENIATTYPKAVYITNLLGNPTHKQLIIFGMTFLFLVYLIKSVFLTYLNWRQSSFSAKLSADISSRLFLGYMRQPYAFHLERNSANLLRNVQGEVNQFSAIAQAAIALSIELSALIGIAFILFLAAPIGALFVTLFLALSSYLFHLSTKKKLLHWGKMRQFFDGVMNKYLLQGLGGIKDVKLMGTEYYFLSKYREQSELKSGVSAKQVTMQQVPRFYLEFIGVAGMSGLVILMLLQNKPIVTIISVISIFLVAAFRMIPSAYRIMAVIQQIRFGKPVIDVLYAEFKMVMENQESEKKSATNKNLEFNNKLVIDHIDYRYPNTSRWVLKNISVTIEKGQSVGFIGPSGHGKSTILDVILGLLIPNAGKIEIDGLDTQTNINGWRSKIGYVPQSIFLTDDTIKRNIAFGIEDERINNNLINQAIQSAKLEGLIETLEKGLETEVGERGVRLSGGQRQRIGIARAIYRNPEVLILDEATSSLDTETEQSVMQCITDLQGKLTIIIVAHRLGTVVHCDKIYELQQQGLVDVTHKIRNQVLNRP